MKNILNKTIFRFGILSFIQLLQIFFPILLYFILMERLTIEIIGKIMTWQMVFYILAGISNYCFPQNLIPISEKLKSSNRTLACYWNRLLQIRFLIIGIFIILMLIFANFLPKVALFSCLILVSRLYNPTSILYILSKNQLLLWFNFFTKLCSLVFIYFIITKENWIITNLFIGISELVFSLLILFFLKWKITFSLKKFYKVMVYLKREIRIFYIQIISLLILFVTIPLTNVFFGDYVSGVVSILEKLVSVIRGISGNLFFAILPNFKNEKIDELYLSIKKSVKLISIFIVFLFLISIGLIFIFKENISQKVNVNFIVYYFFMLMLVWFPIMISTPYQMVCIKLSKWKSIKKNTKIQLVFLMVGLIVLGKLFGILGIVISIILHETINLFVFRRTVLRENNFY